MLSETSLARLQEVHPELMRRVLRLDMNVPHLNIQVTQGLRTWADQDALYAQGRTAPGPIVTNAKGGQSMHNFGFAIDLVPEDVLNGVPNWDINSPAWQKMLSVGLVCGLAEGATWEHKDNPHFYLQELPANPTDQMRDWFLDGGITEVWSKIGSVYAIENTPRT
jgi:peptidoglycan L-alanyl-D-glutamate endopeptidase CwlK